MGTTGRTGWIVALVALVAGIAAPSASASEFAPIDRPGPKLEHSREDLRSSLRCTAGVRKARRKPVLLLSGTWMTAPRQYGYNYIPALRAEGFPYCTLDLPGRSERNTDDIQRRGEYVVYAIRRMYRLAGRRIAIIGHSQGGAVPRWALRFWPDTRRKVIDVIGLAPSHRGSSVVARTLCVLPCSRAMWQQRDNSNFKGALNSISETFAGISYTNIRTRYDVIATPARSGMLFGSGRITNIEVQEVCPLSVADHISLGTFDPVGWALARDALGRRGPARPEAIDRAVCNETGMPGIELPSGLTDGAAAVAWLAESELTSERVLREPPLRRYTRP